MNLQLKAVFFVFLILLTASIGYAYKIVGDTVSYTNAYGQLNVTPHTSYGFIEHTQTITLTSFMPGTQTLDFAFQFNRSIQGQIWYWTGSDWNDITNMMTHSIRYKNYMPQHYYWVSGVNFANDETKTIKITYKAQPGESGKWDLWIKRTQDNITEALDNGYFVHLDPWYNSSLTHRYEINITNSNSTYALKNYVANITIDTATLITAGNMSAICYARIVDASNTSYYYDIENCNNESTIYWTYIGDLPRDRNTNLWFYYGDVADSSIESPANVWAGYDLRMPCNDSTLGYDDSPNGWDYALENTPQLVAGRFGDALDFEEDNTEYMKDTDGDVPVAGKDNAIVDFWINPDTTLDASVGPTLLYTGDGGNWFRINYDDGTNGGWNLRVDGGASTDVTAVATHSSGTWYHMTYFVNTTHRAIYQNGWLLSIAATALPGGLNGGSNGNWIAIDNTQSAGRYYDGIMDEIRTTDGDTSIFINSSHSWIIPDEQIGITIYGLETETGSAPSTAHNLNISVFDEDSTEVQIEYYNYSLWKDGNKFYNGTGSNMTQINLNQSSMQTGEITVKIDKAGYHPRYLLINNDKATGYNLTFYLLETSKAVNVGYLVMDFTGRTLGDALVEIEKNVNGNYTPIYELKTPSDGTISVYLSPETTYRVTGSLSGYSTETITTKPISGAIYDIVLNKSLDIEVESIGIYFSYYFLPYWTRYSSCDNEDFSFNINDKLGNVSFFGLNITLNNTITIGYYDNSTANVSSGKLNMTLDLTDYTGNITLRGNVTIGRFGTYNFTYFYRIDSCSQATYNFTLDHVLRAVTETDSEIGGNIAAIFLIFFSAILATSLASFMGGHGSGIVVFMIEALLPIYGIISWPLYIFIGITLLIVMFIRVRL